MRKAAGCGIAALAALLAGTPAQAGGGVRDVPSSVSTIREELITIGTRGGRERSAVNSAVPVDAFDLETLGAGGQTEVSRMLQMAAPSFNFSTSTISDGTDIVRPATLRGMQPDQTLVLVNGKRRHNSALMHVNGSIGRGTAGVDLNAIPAASIKRIEVLRDGAAAQYGSDAIAGVINVILKDQAETIDPFIQYGSTYEDDGDQILGSVNAGIPLFGDGFLNATFEYRDREATNRAGPDLRQQFNFQEQVLGAAQLADGDGDGTCDTGGTCTPRADEPNAPGSDPSGVLNHRYGDPDSENIYFSWNAALPLGPVEAYTFGGIAQRDGESGGFFRRNYDARSVPAIHPDGFLPLINTNVDDTSAGIGIRWDEMLTFDWDMSLVYGENEFEFIITNSNNVALGPNSPTSANSGQLGTELLVFNVDASRAVDWFQGSQLSWGFEWREDKYTLTPGETASFIGTNTSPACGDAGQPACFDNQYGGAPAAGIQVFPGFQPANRRDDDRDAWALYADLEMDLNDDILLGVALRYEDYSDFGDTLNGKLAGRWNVVDNFAIRGSISTGFRAPSLQQQFFNNISTQFVSIGGVQTPTEVGTFANDSDVVRLGFGVPQLEEETSTNITGGFAWTPTDNFTMTVDLYYIEVEDRVVLSGRFEPESIGNDGLPCDATNSNCPIAAILSPFQVNSAQFFSNAIDTETTGVDIVIDYSTALSGGGFLNLGAGLNFNRVSQDGATRVPSTLVASPGADETLYSRQERLWLEHGQPRQHWILSAAYDRDQFNIVAKANWFGPVSSAESASDPSLDQEFSGKWLVDLEAGWAFTDSIKLVVGANNIFDTTPDENIEANSFGGIFPYNRRTTPFGFNGGFYYGRLVMQFGHGM
jgi:iron complex outermembrane receptor protein